MQLILSTACMALTSAVIGNAWMQKKQFYPAVVYITKSNASMAVIYIQFFVIVFMFGKLLRKIFLGTLRAAEFEHLLERFWYALTETCLAFTVFRDDFNPRFVALFTVLLFLKSFHWLAEERVDFMERSPVLGWLFHVRVASLLVLLGILDYKLLWHAYNSTLVRGPTVQLVFGFEYAILLTVVANTAIKYALHAAEMRTDTPWENKAVFLLYTELVIGLIKVILYVLFVVIMARIYALPMFVFRPMFFTIRNFKKALSDVIMSRRAIRNMNTLYPDATPEELRLSDNICIICREDMVNHSKKLPCGHIFHTTCLRSWFQRQQTCPTCRLNILRTPTVAARAPAGGDRIVVDGEADGLGAPVAARLPAMPPLVPADGGAAVAGASPAPSLGIAAEIPDPLAGPSPFRNVPNLPGLPVVPPPPPFMMPPFPFLAPYNVPPPPMPTDLTSFTDEELKALEGNERRNIEERIKLLRNVQLMLDAAGLLMNNYQIMAARSQQESTVTIDPANAHNATEAATPTSPTNITATDGPSTSAAAAAALLKKEAASTETSSKFDNVTIEDIGGEEHEYLTKAGSFQRTSLAATSTLIEPASSAKATSLPSSASSFAHDASSENGDINELRKRRLKFLQERNQSPSSTNSE